MLRTTVCPSMDCARAVTSIAREFGNQDSEFLTRFHENRTGVADYVIPTDRGAGNVCWNTHRLAQCFPTGRISECQCIERTRDWTNWTMRAEQWIYRAVIDNPIQRLTGRETGCYSPPRKVSGFKVSVSHKFSGTGCICGLPTCTSHETQGN